MRVTVSVPPFRDALSRVAKVVPARSPNVCLQSVRFAADPDAGSTLSGTDLEMHLSVPVLGVKVDAAGVCLIPCEPMRAILAALGDSEDELSLVLDEAGTLVVRGVRCSYELQTEDAATFPVFPEPGDDGATIEVTAADLGRLIRRTLHAMDPSSVRFAMGGALVQADSEAARFVATDGHVLACQDVSATVSGTIGNRQVVIPERALKALSGLLSGLDDDDPVTLLLPPGNLAFVRWASSTLASRLVEGRFPRWQDVVPPPDAATVRATFPREALLSAIEQVAVMTSEESRGVDFAFRGGVLVLSGRATGRGSARVEVGYEGADARDGEAVEVTMMPGYLRDVLKSLGSGDGVDRVCVDVIDGRAAVAVRAEDGLEAVIMPITREG